MKVLSLLLLMTVAAWAHPVMSAQPDQQVSPTKIQQALGQKLMDEIGENVKLRAEISQLREELDKLKKPEDKPK